MDSISLWYQKIAWIDLHIHKLKMNVPRLKLSLVNNSAIILIIIFTQQVRAKFVLWKSSQWHKKLYIKQHLKYAQRLPLRKHILNKPHQAWWIISFSFELNYHFLNWDWRQLYYQTISDDTATFFSKVNHSISVCNALFIGWSIPLHWPFNRLLLESNNSDKYTFEFIISNCYS